MFRPERGNASFSAASPSMTTKYFQIRYNKVKEVTESFHCPIVCFENSEGNAESFVVFIPLFSDKTAKPLNRTALVAYPMQAVLLIMSPKRR